MLPKHFSSPKADLVMRLLRPKKHVRPMPDRGMQKHAGHVASAVMRRNTFTARMLTRMFTKNRGRSRNVMPCPKNSASSLNRNELQVL